jgi:site-specific DNA-methyltransferase (adenine-specific)
LTVAETWKSEDGALELRAGDSLELLAELEAESVDLVLTDPPYFNVAEEAWDRQWKKAGEFLEWLGPFLDEFRRVLKPNGSLYLFASPAMAARVELEIGRRFAVLNSLVWAKPSGRANACKKEDLRAYFPQSERVIFAEQFGADGSALRGSGYAAATAELYAGVFEPLRRYLVEERDRAGLTNRQVDDYLGTAGMAGHYFGASQWALPTATVYDKLRRLFNEDNPNRQAGGHLARDFDHLEREHAGLRREYESLRREFEELREEYEELRRPFTVSREVPFTDVWTFPAVQAYPGKHPCEKPLAILQHMIAASSKPGALVLDAFAGSGATAEACFRLGRRFVGAELDAGHFGRARRRLELATSQLALF